MYATSYSELLLHRHSKVLALFESYNISRISLSATFIVRDQRWVNQRAHVTPTSAFCWSCVGATTIAHDVHGFHSVVKTLHWPIHLLRVHADQFTKITGEVFKPLKYIWWLISDAVVFITHHGHMIYHGWENLVWQGGNFACIGVWLLLLLMIVGKSYSL